MVLPGLGLVAASVEMMKAILRSISASLFCLLMWSCGPKEEEQAQMRAELEAHFAVELLPIAAASMALETVEEAVAVRGLEKAEGAGAAELASRKLDTVQAALGDAKSEWYREIRKLESVAPEEAAKWEEWKERVMDLARQRAVILKLHGYGDERQTWLAEQVDAEMSRHPGS